MRTRSHHLSPQPSRAPAHLRLSTLSSAVVAVLGLVASAPAAAATCTWNTTNGNWNALTNWLNCVAGNGNPGGVPGAADSANIGAAGVVAVTTNQAVNALNNAGTVNVAAGATLQLNRAGGGTVNSGTLNVADNAALSFDARAGAHSISGGGSIVLAGPGSRIFMEGAGTTTLAAGTRIRGAGQIGQAVQQAGSMNFINNGTLSADAAGQSLVLLPPASGGSYTNNSLMEARNGGTLQLSGNVAQGAGGLLKAETGSTVLLNGVGIAGGTLDSAGTGAIRTTNNSTNLLSNSTINGVVDLLPVSQLRLANNAVLNGRIDVGASSNLYFDNRASNGLAATQAITGTGSINLAGGALRVEGTGQTTLGSGVTVAGFGTFGQAILESGNHTLVNDGLISANTNGQTLTLQRMGNSANAVQNNGVLEATGGGTLRVQANVVGATGSQLRAAAGSTIILDNVAVSGSVNTTGGGTVTTTNNSSNLFSNVTLNGVVDLSGAAAQLRLANNAVINGRIDVGGSSNLYFDNRASNGLAATQSITGAGVINLTGGALHMEGTGQTTLGAGMTLAGYGNVGQALLESAPHTLVNDGLISANTSGQTLTLQRIANGNNAVQNNGILEATGGGTLRVQANVVGATGSQLRAASGSTIILDNVAVSGTVNTTGGGTVTTTNNSANLFSNVTLNGAVDMAGAAAQLRLANDAVINGRIDVGGSSNLYIDNRASNGLAATQSITGTGVINLTGGALHLEGTGQTTLGPNLTVAGFGNFGQAILESGNHTVINTGVVSANVAGQTLVMQSPGNGGAWNNQALFEARNGGTMRLDGNVNQGAAGVISADNGSVVLLNSTTVTGGVLASNGSGTLRASNTNANLLSNARLTGVMDMASSASQLRLANNAVIDGRIDVGSSSNLYFDSRPGVAANQALTGSGSINLAGGAIRVEGAGQTTLGPNLTVAGFGSFGQAIITSGAHTLVNDGTLNANVAGQTLTLQSMANNGGITGTGTLQVDGGTLALSTGRVTQQGTLAVGATGTLALGNQNLVLSSDYTNAQAGSGNSFNRRAGVTGTGQIQAGGDVAQVISGAGVTGGNTANATLTIGNVRVGANTYNVNIGNSGTNGPTLRGALQTSVNGGNITDSRLSGSGVTAGNYNAGGPGGAGSSQVITFTAASAGALAPMSGQAINLRSTYDNIADQKLNIVLGSGAAAYNAAVGSTTPAPVVVANQRVGGSGAVALTISNTAAAGAFSEDLNASGGGSTGAALLSGSGVSGLLAGSSQAGALSARVDTTTAGAKTGTVTINYQTTGAVNGVSNGLGTASAGSQTVNVSGNVYQAAAGQLVSAPLNFGTVQVGQVVTQNLVVRNTATGAAGFVEDLNASFGSSSGTGAGLISGSGSLSGVRAGNSSNAGNGSMVVSVNTSAAGTVNGSIAVNYFTAGAVNGVSNGLGTAQVGSEAYGVQGQINATANVINQASPLVNNPTVSLGAVRVGAVAPSGTVSVTNVATVAPQAALNASMGTTSGPATASGSFNLLNPGATNNGSLVVGLNTGTAGNFTGANAGTATINFVSDASNVGNCAPNCQLNLASQTVNVEGKVYTQAVGAASGTSINFGVVRVGDTVSARNITINNTAAVTALNDSLQANLSGVGSAFSGNGSTGPISAQAAGLFSVGLDTSTAGIFSSGGTVAFASHNADMADVSAGANAAVTLAAQVNNLANGDFDLLGGTGTLSQTGTTYVLDLGTVVLGDSVGAQLHLDNDVAGPADDLSGHFDLSAADDFSYSGWNPLALLAAGQAGGVMNINWLAGALGQFTDTITFLGLGTNASDPLGLAQQRQLVIRANVINRGGGGGGDLPEPGTLALLLGAAAAGWAARAAGQARRGVRP